MYLFHITFSDSGEADATGNGLRAERNAVYEQTHSASCWKSRPSASLSGECFSSKHFSLSSLRESASVPVPVRCHGLALFADLEHAGSMPPILHSVIREGRRPFSATGSGSLQPKLGLASPPKRDFIVTPRYATKL